MRFSCGQFSLEVPDGWLDTTEDSEPFTLSKPEGVGALQFSIATYRGGPAPAPTTQQLYSLLADFAETHELGKLRDPVRENGALSLAASSFDPDESTFVRAWYLSDGFSVGKITYTCHASSVGQELAEAEMIVRSLQFTDSGT